MLEKGAPMIFIFRIKCSFALICCLLFKCRSSSFLIPKYQTIVSLNFSMDLKKNYVAEASNIQNEALTGAKNE